MLAAPIMRPTNRITLDRPEQVGEDNTRVVLDGLPTKLTVPAKQVEAQFESRQGTLLFATEDVPHEEALHVMLISDQAQLLDSLELSAPYSTGVLRDVAIADDSAVDFSFFAGDRWRVTVGANFGRRLPWSIEPGVRRRLAPLLAKRRLRLTKLKS